jgi:hypothetical protein
VRPIAWGIAAAGALALAAVGLHGRVRLDTLARPASRGPLVATAIGADTITTTEPYFGLIAFQIPLPAGTVDGDRVELRFREPLDGARVEAYGQGPRTSATLLRKRVGGDTVVVPLAPGRVDTVDVRVHRNFRPPPIVRDVAVLVPAVNRRE